MDLEINMDRKQIILIGGGGHCKACIDIIEEGNEYEIRGILDRKELVGTQVLGYEVIGTDDDISIYSGQGCHFLITVGQIKTALIRKKIFEKLLIINAQIATVISPKAHVSRHAYVGKGTIVMHAVTINAAARIGENCILNTGSNVEHDSTVGDHTHISTSAIINGNCYVGSEVFIGSQVTLLNQINITDHVVVGAGSVVVDHIEKEGIYVGNPAKRIK